MKAVTLACMRSAMTPAEGRLRSSVCSALRAVYRMWEHCLATHAIGPVVAGGQPGQWLCLGRGPLLALQCLSPWEGSTSLCAAV